MKNALVSIIIPFYNEEKQLERAILSAIQQTYSHIEIILINDGSTDASLDIAERLAKKDSLLSLVSIANSGLSIARNTGISIAKGEYISFLDSDDQFEPEAIKTLVSNLEEQNSCIAISKFFLKTNSSEIIATSGWKSDRKLISSGEAIAFMYSGKITYTAWAKLYKSSIVKNISFPEKLWFEDRPFILEYFIHSKLVSFVDNPLLSIYTSPDSISRRIISKKRVSDIQSIWEIETRMAQKNMLEKTVLSAIFNHHLTNLYETALLMSMDKTKAKDFKEIVKLFNQNLQATLTQSKSFSISLKAKLNLYFLFTNRILGWPIFEFILKKRKANHFNRIKTLRQH